MAVGKFSQNLQAVFVQKCKYLGAENHHFVRISGKEGNIDTLSTHNLVCQKFATVPSTFSPHRRWPLKW